MELEHLCGVTRLAERGNNHGQRIMRRLVKSSFLARIAEHWGLTLKRKHQRNISGVYDGMLTSDEFLDLNDLFTVCKPAESLFEILAWKDAVPESFDTHPGFQTCHHDFVVLLGRIKDGQKLPAVTCLSDTAIVAGFKRLTKLPGIQNSIGLGHI
jgi:hypothetical protein